MAEFQAFIQSLNFWQWVGFILFAAVFRPLTLRTSQTTTTNKTANGGGARVG